MVGLAGPFGLTYALYSLVANLLAIDKFPFVGLVTCGWNCLIGVLFRDGVTFWIGLSFLSGDFTEMGVPLLVALLQIDSFDPFEIVDTLEIFEVVGPTYLMLDVLELCANRGEFVLFKLELFWMWLVVGVEVIDFFDEFWLVGESCVESGDFSSCVDASFGR